MSQSAEAMPTRVEKGRFGEGGKAYSETLFGDFPRYLNKSDAYHRHPRNDLRGRGGPCGRPVCAPRALTEMVSASCRDLLRALLVGRSRATTRVAPTYFGTNPTLSLFTPLRSLPIGFSHQRVTLPRSASELPLWDWCRISAL